MQVTGKIVKVAGPLIVADGMTGAKMYDVVGVSTRRLIGEIIEMRGDKAWIQVYEDTGGLGPGEPVVSADRPLSVELGPGLIGAIYDGIQRPLDAIFQKTGDRIGRGVTAPALDREKKWHFVPSLSRGAAVQGGDILGTVQETAVVAHKILVPPGIKGTIEAIGEGDYTVTDPVAKISTASGIEDIPMLQLWPVRQGRPYQEKLAPNEPLVSGQRVIDTFFPVAKGGTAAIPGPFGSGKCVSELTPVLLVDGSFLTMGELYAKGRKAGKVTRLGAEETVRLNRPLEVFALQEGGFAAAKVALLYKGKSDLLLRLRTDSGKVLEVTPIHKLFRVNGKGEITETQAQELRVGDFLASPRKLPEIAAVKSSVELALSPAACSEREEAHELDAGCLQDERIVCQGESSVREVPTAVGEVAIVSGACCHASRASMVKMPTRLSGQLAELFGLFAAAGRLEGRRLVFTGEGSLRRRVLTLLRREFSVRGELAWHGDKAVVLVENQALAEFCRQLDLATGKFPTQVLRGERAVLEAFLRGYYLGGGVFAHETMELSAPSQELRLGLSYLLTRLGILHTICGEKSEARIFIRGLENLRLCFKAIVTQEFHDKLEDFEKCLAERSGADERCVLGDELYCDKIVEIQELAGPHDVYDLMVPDGHNFVGGFGASILHNTVVQHQLAKWSDADIIVYIGCGERGNEMTDVLREFPALVDPRTGEPLMKRTVLVANTSDMPVAAREASIYTGITIAEYFRDMGYHVALMADSTSRWAEALREMSGRLEEMPGEEGYPAYLGSRLAEFYERAGRVICLGQEGRQATLTAIGAVSPPGGDLSEPVTQATLRIVKVFWGLDANLAYRRHFPAINWLRSYSLYTDQLRAYFVREIGEEALQRRDEAMRILQQEAELEEIVRLVGEDALSFGERMVLATARSLREDFLHQVAYHQVDTFTPLAKQAKLLALILKFHHLALKALELGADLQKVLSLPVRESIGRAKYIPAERMAELDKISRQIETELSVVGEGERELA
jgi:V/A-type H+-transporting ATPase subunit A